MCISGVCVRACVRAGTRAYMRVRVCRCARVCECAVGHTDLTEEANLLQLLPQVLHLPPHGKAGVVGGHFLPGAPCERWKTKFTVREPSTTVNNTRREWLLLLQHTLVKSAIPQNQWIQRKHMFHLVIIISNGLNKDILLCPLYTIPQFRQLGLIPSSDLMF